MKPPIYVLSTVICGSVLVFGNNLSLLNASYTLEPIEEKERIINMTHVDHG